MGGKEEGERVGVGGWGGAAGRPGRGGSGEEGIIIELFTRLPYTRRPFMYTLTAPNIHI